MRGFINFINFINLINFINFINFINLFRYSLFVKGLWLLMSYCVAARSIWKPRMKVSTATMMVPVGEGQFIEA